MKGTTLALGAVGALVIGAAARRGSRANTQSYLCGRCYALALALHKDTGAATWGMFDASGAMHHAFVVRADGLAVDARGLRVVDHVGEGSSVENPTYRPVTVAEIANTAFLNSVVEGPPRWRDPEIREARAFAAKNGLIALALASRHRGSAARRPPLDYDALADDFRAWYVTLGWEVDEERELRRWARGHGIVYLGAGAQRAVFGVPGGALKLAFDRDGRDANRREAEVWEDAPADIRRHLVPVLANSGMEPGEGAWLVMERVKASARGKLPEEAAARLSACGFNDIVGQNLSDDGRLLDYGWMYMDAWAPCATPGSTTSNRPAGSATRGAVASRRRGSRDERDGEFFHVTEAENVSDILANGFVAGWGDVGLGVYFYGSYESARTYARRGGWDKKLRHPVLLVARDPRIRKIESYEIHGSWDASKYEDMYVLDGDENDEDAPIRPAKVTDEGPIPPARAKKSNRPAGSVTRGPTAPARAPAPFPWSLDLLLRERDPFRPVGRRDGWSPTSPNALAAELSSLELVSIVGSARANIASMAWVRAHDAELRGASSAEVLYDLFRRFDAEVVRPAREHLETKGARAREKLAVTRVARVDARRAAAAASDPGPVTTLALGRAWAKTSAIPGPLYHATRAGPVILAEGLLPRRAVGVREREAGVARPGLGTLGGGPDHVVSLTSDRAAARRIAAALQALNEAQRDPRGVYDWFATHWLPHLERWNPPAGKRYRQEGWHGPPTAQRVREMMSEVGSYIIGQDAPVAMRVPWIMGTPLGTAPETIGVVTAYAHVDQLYSSGFGNRGRTWGRIVKEWTAGSDGFGNMRVGCPSRRGGLRSTEGQALPSRVAELERAALVEATLNPSEGMEVRICAEDLTVVGFEPVTQWRKVLMPPPIARKP